MSLLSGADWQLGGRLHEHVVSLVSKPVVSGLDSSSVLNWATECVRFLGSGLCGTSCSRKVGLPVITGVNDRFGFGISIFGSVS